MFSFGSYVEVIFKALLRIFFLSLRNLTVLLLVIRADKVRIKRDLFCLDSAFCKQASKEWEGTEIKDQEDYHGNINALFGGKLV